MSVRIGLRLAPLALLGAFAPGHPVHAQPSPAEVQAIRSACRGDFISHCMGVQPGGREALECLASHAPQLSAACGAAVSAVTAKSDVKPETAEPAPQNANAEKANGRPETAVPTESPATSAPATGQSPAQELAAVSKVCTLSDVAAHCSFIAPDNPELVLCLKANAVDLSPACHAVVTGLAAAPPEAAPDVAPPAAVAAPAVAAPPPPAAIAAPAEPPPPAASTPSGPPPPAAAPARRPTQQQIGAIRAACRSDFISHCSGVQPGGPEALQCLERSKAEVSSRCRAVLAAITPGAAQGGAPEPPPAAAPPSPPAEGFTIRPLRPREEFAILRLCIEEARGLCGGIPPGGGRIISCLARNASQLSPRCRAAMDEARN
jgi:hypothetical protein